MIMSGMILKWRWNSRVEELFNLQPSVPVSLTRLGVSSTLNIRIRLVLRGLEDRGGGKKSKHIDCFVDLAFRVVLNREVWVVERF
jgi:hypothetical protein